MDNFLNRLNRNPYQPIDGASVTRVDELGNGYDDWNNLIAPKFEAPEQTWGETALGVATAPARMATALAGSLSPYGADGWQVPPIVNEGVNALTAVGDAYNYGMSDDEINSRALGMAGFMMGGGGLAAKSPVSRAANLFPDQPRAMSADLFAEAVPAGERFGARTAAADPRQSKHWPSWGDREPDRAAAHVREQEAADAWFSIVDPIMYDERGLKRMERHEAEALAIERFPDALDKGFAYKEAAKAWNEIDKGRPMTAAEQAWFDLDLAPGRARTSRNEIMRDIVMPNMIMPDGSTGVQHMAAANGPKKLYSNASKEGAASIYSGLLDRLSSAYAPDGQLNMFGGRNAKTANLERLAIAERLAAEGADRRAIWDQTGWFQGPDSKWRFEIDDSGSSVRNSFMDAVRSGSPLALMDDQATSAFGATYTNADNLMSHPALFDAYPEARGVSIGASVSDTPFAQYGGWDRPDHIQIGAQDAGGFRKSALHEMQHDLQRREGFAYGGTATEGDGIGYLGQSRPDLEADYNRLAGEVEARNVQTRMNMTPEQRRATPPWETQDIPFEDQIVRLYSNASKEGALPAIASALSERQPFTLDKIDGEYAAMSSSGDMIGNFRFEETPQAAFVVDAMVKPEYRRQGVASQVYGAIQDDLGKPLTPDVELTPDGYAFWKQHYPDAVQNHEFKNGRWIDPVGYVPDEVPDWRLAGGPNRPEGALWSNADSKPALLASALGQDDIPDWLLPYLPPQ